MDLDRIVLTAAIVAAASFGACSEQDENYPTNPAAKTYDTIATTRVAASTGSVRVAPLLRFRELMPTAIHSSYFMTTDKNAEYRRGMLEFAGAAGDDTVFKAVLALTPGSGWSSSPATPNKHILSWYNSNQKVEDGDFDRRTTEIGSFMTDINDTARPTLYFDVTSAIKAAGSGGIGFRVQLENDSDLKFAGAGGMDFQESLQGNPPMLLITTIRAR